VGTHGSISAKTARRRDVDQLIEIEIDNRRNASPVVPSRNASGSASSQAAYWAYSARIVATADCHRCARLERRIGRDERGGAAARLPMWRWR
jgi:hypothetical protein